MVVRALPPALSLLLLVATIPSTAPASLIIGYPAAGDVVYVPYRNALGLSRVRVRVALQGELRGGAPRRRHRVCLALDSHCGRGRQLGCHERSALALSNLTYGSHVLSAWEEGSEDDGDRVHFDVEPNHDNADVADAEAGDTTSSDALRVLRPRLSSLHANLDAAPAAEAPALVSVQRRDYGLTHRLRNIAGAYAAAVHLGRRFFINWEPSPGCAARWDELFHLPFIQSLDVARETRRGRSVAEFGDFPELATLAEGTESTADIVVIDAGFGDLRPGNMPCRQFVKLKGEFYQHLLAHLHPAVRDLLAGYPLRLTNRLNELGRETSMAGVLPRRRQQWQNNEDGVYWHASEHGAPSSNAMHEGRRTTDDDGMPNRGIKGGGIKGGGIMGGRTGGIIGVHLRGHSRTHDIPNVPHPSYIPRTFDETAPLGRFVSIIQQMHRKDPAARFFVASNKGAHVRALQALFGRTLILGDVARGRGGVEGIRGALADWAVLSTASDVVVGTFWSGFSDEAAAVRGTPKIMVRADHNIIDPYWSAPGCGSGGHSSSNCAAMYNGGSGAPMVPCRWLVRRWGVQDVFCAPRFADTPTAWYTAWSTSDTRRAAMAGSPPQPSAREHARDAGHAGHATHNTRSMWRLDTVQPLHRLEPDRNDASWNDQRIGGTSPSGKAGEACGRLHKRGCVVVGDGYSIVVEGAVIFADWTSMTGNELNKGTPMDGGAQRYDSTGANRPRPAEQLPHPLSPSPPQSPFVPGAYVGYRGRPARLPYTERVHIAAVDTNAVRRALSHLCTLRRVPDKGCRNLHMFGAGMESELDEQQRSQNTSNWSIDSNGMRAMLRARRMEVSLTLGRLWMGIPVTLGGASVSLRVGAEDNISLVVQEFAETLPGRVSNLSPDVMAMLYRSAQESVDSLGEDNGGGYAAKERAVRGFSYRSSLGQDEWVLSDVTGGQRAGTFVDVFGGAFRRTIGRTKMGNGGARDGVQDSNTEILETVFGWHGVCLGRHSEHGSDDSDGSDGSGDSGDSDGSDGSGGSGGSDGDNHRTCQVSVVEDHACDDTVSCPARRAGLRGYRAGLLIDVMLRNAFISFATALPATLDYLSIGLPLRTNDRGCPMHAGHHRTAMGTLYGRPDDVFASPDAGLRMLRGLAWDIISIRAITVALANTTAAIRDDLKALMSERGYALEREWDLCGDPGETRLTELWFVQP